MDLPDPLTHPVMTVEEVGACLGISRATAYRWAAGDTLPVIAWPGGRRVATADLYALLCVPLPVYKPVPPRPRVITLYPAPEPEG